ncbi:MAG: alpha-2-macroglobulin family protein [Candidatus Micrarchaeota archaeon]
MATQVLSERNKIVLLLVIAVAVLAWGVLNQPAEPGPGVKPLAPYGAQFLAVAPKVLYTGADAAVAFTALTAGKQPANAFISVYLKDAEGVKTLLFEEGTKASGRLSKSFKVPELPEGSYKLEFQALGSSEVLEAPVVLEKGFFFLIETDKPIYKPGQTLHARVIALTPDLKPFQTELEVNVNDAKAIKLFKKTLQTNEYGVASFDLPIASEVNYGTWRVSAVSGSVQSQVDVRVEEYVLPKFDVSVSTPKNWFLVSEEIPLTIDAKYFFGEPVEGKAKIRAYKYVGEWQEYFTREADLQNGQVSIDLPEVEYVAGTLGASGAGSLLVNVTVTDTGGHEEKSTELYKIVDSETIIQLIPDSNSVKPGLPFQVLIVAENPVGEPVETKVVLNAEYYGDDDASEEHEVTTVNGVALVSLSIPKDVYSVNLQAVEKANEQNLAEKYLGSAYSPSDSFIHLIQHSQGTADAGREIAFDVYSTNKGTVYYEVVSKGKTVFSSFTYANQISFQVTPEMAPDAKVIAYIINPNNEVSADALPFSVKFEPTASLHASFGAVEKAPGDEVEVFFSTNGIPSMVGYAIVDESVYALAEGRLNLQQVFNELERIFAEPRAEAHPEGEWWGPVYETESAESAFKDAGLQVVASKGLEVPSVSEAVKGGREAMGGFLDFGVAMRVDAEAAQGAMPPNAAPTATGGLAEVTRVRQFFPETWVWEPGAMTNQLGELYVPLTAPDSITNWKLHAVSTSQQGLGFAETELKVFQSFFVEPDLPYSVTRGEEFPVRVLIYNYEDSVQDVFVEIKDAEWFDLLSSSGSLSTMVDANSVASIDFTIKPTKVGVHELELTARTPLVADAVVRELIVEPEGVERELVENGVLKPGESKTLDTVFFDDVVEDSQKALLSITPSLVAQTINGLEDLLDMPYGCGEQNMLLMSTDVQVLRYLKSTQQLNPELSAKAEFFITTGYQRELTYQRNDGSFSAFGDSDEEGSLWLTDFVLMTFSNAREVYPAMDETVLAQASDWVLSHQNADGSFESVGFVHHQDMMGGVNGKFALTAYTAKALLDYGQASESKVAKAVSYLENHLNEEKDNALSLALAAIVFQKSGSAKASEAVDMLLDLSKQDENGLYWEGIGGGGIEPMPLMRDEVAKCGFGRCMPVSAQSVETTAYAALALINAEKPQASEAVKWIVAQRNSHGGFASTQDTVVAFQALVEAAVKQQESIDATVTVLVDGVEFASFDLNKRNYDVLQSVELPLDHEIELKLEGTGQSAFQLVKKFNLPALNEPIFNDLELSVDYDSTNVAVDDIVTVTTKVKYVGFGKTTGMLIVDVAVPTGFAPVIESLDELKEDGKIMRFEIAGRKIILYVEDLERGVSLTLPVKVKAKYPVKALIESSSAYSYYDQGINAQTIGGEIQVV